MSFSKYTGSPTTRAISCPISAFSQPKTVEVIHVCLSAEIYPGNESPTAKNLAEIEQFFLKTATASQIDSMQESGSLSE
ncbi:hypothetical protein NCH01_31210 [Neoasaia chiangmaiensis]|nr:hypothetical protein NCH01_31210 [Neoasaia chiangmaiensis]